MAYAGIDVGTSGCKMVVYDKNGKILSSASRSYSQTGGDGYRELDPNTVMENVMETILEAAAASKVHIDCIAVASMGESIVCLDESGYGIFPSMLTGDKRGIAECDFLREQISEEKVHEITGLPLSELYALPKWIWISRQTDVFDRSKHIFFYEDFIGWMLTGVKKVSFSSAARSMAFDIRSCQWCEELLSFANLTPERLSQPVPSGTILGPVLPDMASKLGLSSDTLVAAGGHDQSCCALGSGMIDETIGEDGQGTCEVMEFILPSPISNEFMIKNGIACAPHIIPGKFLAQIEIPNCGILMNWARDSLFSGIKDQCAQKGDSFFQYMDNAVKGRVPGNLYIFPSFGSAGNPDVSTNSRGTIWGLTVHTDPFDLFQGLKEGMAYQIYMAYTALDALGIHPQRIRVTGGGSLSDYTMQLRADVFGIPMERTDNEQAGTLACAMIAANACHPELTFRELANTLIHPVIICEPRKPFHQKYMHHYRRYKKLYDALLEFSNHPEDF